MATLFQQIQINNLTLQNRIVRSATWEGMCRPDGGPTPKLIDTYRRLAQGGVGLIVTGFAFVRPEGKQMPGMMGFHSDDSGVDFQAMTRAVHEAGGRIAVQLVHAGGQTTRAMAGRQPLAPSAVATAQFPELAAELSATQIAEITAAFAQGARRARSWGFDAVQLHSAHGYLINQFLSPLTNQRQDSYGGSRENRCRFLMEVYQQVRQAVGSDFPVIIKLNGADNLEGGLALEDALHAVRWLSAAGIDAIEVSAGTPASGPHSPARTRINRPEKEAYHLALAGPIKAAAKCPVMVVGGFRSYAVAQQAVGEAGMAAICMSRPLIREPDLPRRWQAGDLRPAQCISCNGCFKPGLEEGGIYCVAEKKEREKAAAVDS